MKSSPNNFLQYLWLLLSHTGDFVGSGITGLVLLITSVYYKLPLGVSISLFTVAIIIGLVISGYHLYSQVSQELHMLKMKLLDDSQSKVKISITRQRIPPYNLLDITNIGQEDVINLKIRIDNRLLPVLDENTKISLAHEITPNILNQSQTVRCHFPSTTTKVTITATGKISGKEYMLEQTV